MPISKLFKAYLKFLTAALLLAAVLYFGNALISNALEFKTLPAQTGIFLKRRMQSMLRSLPELMRSEEKLAFFWGASEIENGIETQALDAVFSEGGLNLKAVNAGMRNVHPVVYEKFSDRVRESLIAQNKKIAVSFVKVPVTKLTRRFADKSPLDMMSDQMSVLVKPQDAQSIPSYPELYLTAFAQHNLLMDATTHVVSTWTQAKLKETFVTKEETDLERYFSIWTHPIFMERQFWNLSARGSYRWNLPESASELQRRLGEKKHPLVRESSYRFFDQCCGMNNIVVDKGLLRTFIKHVKNVERVSNRVVLYAIPEEAPYSASRTAEFERNKTALFAQISIGTGLIVYDVSDQVTLSDSDYVDFLHLSEAGQRKFYPVLLKTALPASRF